MGSGTLQCIEYQKCIYSICINLDSWTLHSLHLLISSMWCLKDGRAPILMVCTHTRNSQSWRAKNNLRGIPYMTSAKTLDFFCPLPRPVPTRNRLILLHSCNLPPSRLSSAFAWTPCPPEWDCHIWKPPHVTPLRCIPNRRLQRANLSALFLRTMEWSQGFIKILIVFLRQM